MPYLVLANSFLSEDFLNKYENLIPKNKGPLFEVVYLRTYSRWRPEVKRRENWLETVQRVVEYNMALGGTPTVASKEEAEQLFDRIFHLKLLPAGRALWIGGTQAVEKHSESAFNCSFISIDDLECFCEIFHLLLCGCGVGFSVLEENINKLPETFPKTLRFMEYKPRIKEERLEESHAFMHSVRKNTYCIRVGDSKQGWVQALRYFLKAYTNPKITDIIFDVSSVRPKGERIMTFGGRAPGPDGLIEMFKKVGEILGSSNKITTVGAVDIANLVAKNVIVGGTRRSSQIALGEPHNIEFINAKLPENLNKNSHRTMSNNTVQFMEKPSIEKIEQMFANIMANGEPGFMNLQAALKRRPNAKGTNPCGEILLDSRGFCNLSTVVITSHIEDGILNEKDLLESVALCTRVGVRQTNVTVSLPEWDRIQKRDRLTGVSMTGWMDAIDALGWKYDDENAIRILKDMNHTANSTASFISHQLGIPEPLLVTAIKPEGTLSQLPTVSSGLHRSYAPYFIRRIRVSSMDPVAQALVAKGMTPIPDPNKSERWVFEFPIKTSAKLSANDEPALDQLNRYLIMQKYYTDHNSSCTLTISEDELPKVIEKVHEEWDNIVACAWLPKWDMPYPLMPYEACSELEYQRRYCELPDLTNLDVLVNKFELEEFESELEEDPSCAGGQCPVR